MLGPRRRRDESGTAALEFALVCPILVVLVMGIVNVGFVLAQQISISNVARQAARTAVVDGPTCGTVKSDARQDAATIGMTAAEVPTPTISPCASDTLKPCAGATAGTNVSVTVSRSASWVVPFPPLFSSSTAPTISSTGVMRCEFS